MKKIVVSAITFVLLGAASVLASDLRPVIPEKHVLPRGTVVAVISATTVHAEVDLPVSFTVESNQFDADNTALMLPAGSRVLGKITNTYNGFHACITLLLLPNGDHMSVAGTCLATVVATTDDVQAGDSARLVLRMDLVRHTDFL